MPTEKSSLESALCVVLRAQSYGEADWILSLFARDAGLVSARAYGARSLKSRIRAACQPFCLAEFEFYVKGDSRTVKAAAIRSEFAGIRDNYDAYTCACLVVETIEKVIRHAYEHSELFRLTVTSLTALSNTEDPAAVLLFFLLRLVHELGVFPSLGSCVHCGQEVGVPHFWSSIEGGVVCDACSETLMVGTLPEDLYRCLRHFGRGQIREMDAAGWSAATIRAAVYLLIDYLKNQYDLNLRTVRSLRF